MKTLDIRVGGTHCPSCSMLIEMTLDELDGVESASCDHARGLATVTFDENVVVATRLVEAIEAAGYEASLETATEGAGR